MVRLLFHKQPHFQLTMLVVVALLVLLSGCSKSIGDACSTGSDCPSGVGAVCDNTIQDGYCLVPNCHPGTCPSPSICVVFDRDTRYCMAPCESAGNCRQGFACRKDYNYEGNSVGYCYEPAPSAPSAQ